MLGVETLQVIDSQAGLWAHNQLDEKEDVY